MTFSEVVEREHISLEYRDIKVLQMNSIGTGSAQGKGKEFMQKLNVEMARINGWIHSKEEAKEEFGLSETEINQCWNYNLKIGIGEGRNLLGLPDARGA